VKIFLYYVGKPRDRHANAMAEEYIKRLARYARCHMSEIRPERVDLWSKHPAAAKILLDPAGGPMDSVRFAGLISRAQREARDLVFVVGGADGLPSGWKPRADQLLSLSPMTLPHELARVMLAEQLYRAFSALHGHPYSR
jgi:23S rRNA (pseudouridine1915-N3)-methyltransferase